MHAFAPTGSRIVGTLERIEARAEAREDSFGRESGGTVWFDYEGVTEVFWDTEETAKDERGERLFLDEAGQEWAESEVVLSADADWKPA